MDNLIQLKIYIISRIGDSMEYNKNEIGNYKGNDAPIVRGIQGRKSDFIYSADGAKISLVNMANGFKNIPNSIIKSQVIQNEIGKVTILLEIDEDSYQTEYDGMLIDEFKHKLGIDTKININHVDEIPREKSGKFRMIKNNV